MTYAGIWQHIGVNEDPQKQVMLYVALCKHGCCAIEISIGSVYDNIEPSRQ